MENSTSITVTWGPVECRHRNGEIIGYYVKYGEEGDGQMRMDLSGDSRGGMTTVYYGLTKQTTYTVEVAARTSAVTGGLVYSELQTIKTPDSKQQSLIKPLIYYFKIQMSSSV